MKPFINPLKGPVEIISTGPFPPHTYPQIVTAYALFHFKLIVDVHPRIPSYHITIVIYKHMPLTCTVSYQHFPTRCHHQNDAGTSSRATSPGSSTPPTRPFSQLSHTCRLIFPPMLHHLLPALSMYHGIYIHAFTPELPDNRYA